MVVILAAGEDREEEEAGLVAVVAVETSTMVQVQGNTV